MAISSAVEAVSDVVKPYIDRIFKVKIDESGKIKDPTPEVKESPVEEAARLQKEREQAAAVKAAADLAAAQEAQRLLVLKQQQEEANRVAAEEKKAADAAALAQKEAKKLYVLKNHKKTSDGADMTYKVGEQAR